MKLRTLEKSNWQRLASEHRDAMRRWTEPFRKRRRIGKQHPVEDFLFVYYRYSSRKIERWHPGIGVRLVGAGDHRKQFPDVAYRMIDPSPNSRVGVNCDLVCEPDLISPKLKKSLAWILDLLRRTQSNQPNFSCLGLHEWAMVYRGQEVRHEKTTRLRLPQEEIDELVQSRPLTCTHFDAFRFYAIDAKPLNRTQPTLEDRPSQEQTACIHANMDLYKWAFRTMPWIGSELLAKCFHLAMYAREIDMRASPYDLTDYGSYEPIKIETAEGRAEYERLQRGIAEQAKPLRLELIDAIEAVLNLRQ